ncbi:dUTP diphosphatase [Bacillus kexueae]|uniref:dUTP diphosphatase n=1 Tax=Aeribacillus kexueae TaxID=2078952 RepID=UPI001FAEB9DA|nr:dUTP diphosphatase [Bacillus kexueae]
MDVQKLFDLQYVLDNHIETKHQLQHESLLKRKVLAFLVELGELANETRCFKFWSVKPPSEKEIILEEYVDGLHFLLSIGLELNLQDVSFSIEEDKKIDLTDHFLNLFQAISEVDEHTTLNQYKALFTQYIQLGLALEFSVQNIYDAYISKNEVNHERQNQGY